MDPYARLTIIGRFKPELMDKYGHRKSESLRKEVLECLKLHFYLTIPAAEYRMN